MGMGMRRSGRVRGPEQRAQPGRHTPRGWRVLAAERQRGRDRARERGLGGGGGREETGSRR
eukprot:3541603-Rhodomonas_salina.1